MNPIIGMLIEIDNECTAKAALGYVHAVEAAGGIPLVFPYLEQEKTIARLIGLCDGFLFTGGFDIDPKYYGETPSLLCGEIQPYRDRVEFLAVERILKTQKPIMGICRGAQLLNIALGGTLYQDLPSECNVTLNHRQTEPKNVPTHGVLIQKSTPLFDLIGREQMIANSFHHQAIKTLGKNLEVMALSEDGIIEAVYQPGARYLRAYQWHPERLFDLDAENRCLFEDFIATCSATQLSHS